MDRNIVTQVGIEDLKFALSEIAENLDAHINASLSRAHGINLITGYVDADGNDLTKYYDSNGDVIGNYFLRFVVNSVMYFAPAITTTLPGQDPTTGIIDTSPEGEFDSQGGSAWVTDYTSDQVAQANAINQDVLIPHTRQPHATTHGSMTIVLQDTFSSLGHRVGTHVLQMRIGNNVYNIPCVTRIGGTLQPPRIGGIPTNLSVSIGSGDPNDCNVPITVPFNGGTKPVEYHWQYNNSGVWTDITPAASGSLALPGWDSGITFQWADTSNPTFRITSVHPGSDQTRSAQFRCRVTNSASPDSGPTSGVITNVCTFTATDNTGKWLCGVARDLGYISEEDYQVDLRFSTENHDPVIYDGYSCWAKPLAGWFLKHPKAFIPVAPLIKGWTREIIFQCGLTPKGSLVGKAVIWVGVTICLIVGEIRKRRALKLSTGTR